MKKKFIIVIQKWLLKVDNRDWYFPENSKRLSYLFKFEKYSSNFTVCKAEVTEVNLLDVMTLISYRQVCFLEGGFKSLGFFCFKQWKLPCLLLRMKKLSFVKHHILLTQLQLVKVLSAITRPLKESSESMKDSRIIVKRVFTLQLQI